MAEVVLVYRMRLPRGRFLLVYIGLRTNNASIAWECEDQVDHSDRTQLMRDRASMRAHDIFLKKSSLEFKAIPIEYCGTHSA